jgi:ribosomal protein S25
MDTVVLKKKTDWRQFLPLKGTFTKKDLAQAVHIRPNLAYKTLYVLEKAGLVKKLEKQGRAWLYQGC